MNGIVQESAATTPLSPLNWFWRATVSLKLQVYGTSFYVGGTSAAVALSLGWVIMKRRANDIEARGSGYLIDYRKSSTFGSEHRMWCLIFIIICNWICTDSNYFIPCFDGTDNVIEIIIHKSSYMSLFWNPHWARITVMVLYIGAGALMALYSFWEFSVL